MLYQHTPGNQQKILEEAVKATKRDGIVIVQDFAEKIVLPLLVLNLQIPGLTVMDTELL